MGRLLGFLFLVSVLIASTQATTLYDDEVRVLNEIIGNNKDAALKNIRPPGEPTNVTVNMYVRSILSLNENKHVWKVQLTFRQEWTDTRLSYTPTVDGFNYLPYSNTKDIWVPDLFFTNEIEAEDHSLLTPNNLIRIFPDGSVVYSTRVTLELFCPTDFNHNEFTCPIRIASYGFTKDQINIQWKSETPLQVNKDIFVPNYTFKGVTTSTCDSTTLMGTFGCIKADFTFGHSICKA